MPRIGNASGRKAISLFCSAGLGELGLKALDIQILVANELLADRCQLYRENYPSTHLIEGDIWEQREKVIAETQRALQGDELFLVYGTPPCQGMSTNGAGKLLAEIRAGRRPTEEARNRLIIPAMDVIRELRPRWILLENVPGMRNTVIRTDHGPRNVLDYVAERLGSDYAGGGEVMACCDYGIPQLRKRLISVFTRDSQGKRYYRAAGNTFFPPEEKTDPPTLRSAIEHLPPLDSKEGSESCPSFHPLHCVGVMKPEKYWWVMHTPEGDTAFNNQCVNPECGYQGNERQSDLLVDGRWKASRSTPIYCVACGELLPRPSMVDAKTGERRLISGFHSAYRRMRWDEPARTLTRNYLFEASDNKLHPSQNRVLSTYEALVIQTIADYEYHWSVEGKPVTQGLIARAIGESVPPRLIQFIAKKLIAISTGSKEYQNQHSLF